MNPENATPPSCATILLTYRRPQHTTQVLAALRRDNVQNIIFVSDAPAKTEHVGDVEATRALFYTIDWTVPTKIFRDQNLGLAKSVIDSVNFAFETFDEVIVLEDDCVPAERFFELAHLCLAKYRKNMEVFGFSGYAPVIPNTILQKIPYDVIFLPRISSWGWATWKDRWQQRIPDLRTAIQECLDNKIPLGVGGEDLPTYILGALQGTLHDTWTLPWALTLNRARAVFVFPAKPQIDNIGFDGTGVHCSSSQSTCISQKLSDQTLRIPDYQCIHPEIYREFCRQLCPKVIVKEQWIQNLLNGISST